ncbi:MAG: AgmX/PglI C-terminal domain-containing protein, partial [Deltaproteobacteria bacterium]|nr:AgmX/PglI C-terminal domain-containing protein [Deltaproteobacteria bacterium]
FGILVGCLLFDFGSVKAVSLRAPVAEAELTLEDLPDRFVKMIVPEKPKEPPKPKVADAEAGGEDKKGDDKKGDDKPKGDAKPKGPAAPVDAAARAEKIRQGVANKGLLKMLGAIGDGGGGTAIEDVLGGGAAGQDIASALAGAGGVGVATADGLAEGGGRKGGGSGEAAGIGDLATSGGAGAAGGLGEKKVAAVTGRVIDSGGPEVDSTSCDREAISKYVKSRLRAIQNCYEKELKRNVSLKGKVVIRFTIGESGRVMGQPEVEEDTLGNEAVTSCIRNTIRMWMFPIKDNECPVAYPFIFQPSSG